MWGGVVKQGLSLAVSSWILRYFKLIQILLQYSALNCFENGIRYTKSAFLISMTVVNYYRVIISVYLISVLFARSIVIAEHIQLICWNIKFFLYSYDVSLYHSEASWKQKQPSVQSIQMFRNWIRINAVNFDSVEKLLIMFLFLKSPTATRRSFCLCKYTTDGCLFNYIISKLILQDWYDKYADIRILIAQISL